MPAADSLRSITKARMLPLGARHLAQSQCSAPTSPSHELLCVHSTSPTVRMAPGERGAQESHHERTAYARQVIGSTTDEVNQNKKYKQNKTTEMKTNKRLTSMRTHRRVRRYDERLMPSISVNSWAKSTRNQLSGGDGSSGLPASTPS